MTTPEPQPTDWALRQQRRPTSCWPPAWWIPTRCCRHRSAVQRKPCAVCGAAPRPRATDRWPCCRVQRVGGISRIACSDCTAPIHRMCCCRSGAASVLRARGWSWHPTPTCSSTEPSAWRMTMRWCRRHCWTAASNSGRWEPAQCLWLPGIPRCRAMASCARGWRPCDPAGRRTPSPVSCCPCNSYWPYSSATRNGS